MFPFYRFNANFSFKREPYRDEFLYEKSLKIDIFAERFALTALFSCKNEIFSSADRAFYKDLYSGTVRANALF